MIRSSPDPAAVFTRAAEDFDAGRYVAAVQGYENLLSLGLPNAPVYFNLGNAYFRAGDLGRAVWAYRSAALRAPRDPDIEANLTVARLTARDRIEAKSPGLIRQVWRTLSGVPPLLSRQEARPGPGDPGELGSHTTSPPRRLSGFLPF